MKLYKLTTQDNLTRKGEDNETKWGKNITHRAKPGKGELCSEFYIHAYTSPLVAVFMNPAHANIDDPKMWESRGRVAKREGQLKCGCKSLTTIKTIPIPIITTEQRVEIAIRSTMLVCDAPKWKKWAEGWLAGTDRTAEAAEEATWVARAGAAAEVAAEAAACAAGAAGAAEEATCAAWAGAAVRAAAQAAGRKEFDLHLIIQRVLEGWDK